MSGDAEWRDPIEQIINDETLSLGEKLQKAGCPSEKINEILLALNDVREVASRPTNYPTDRALSHSAGREHLRDYYQALADAMKIVRDYDILSIIEAEIDHIQATYFGEQYRKREI